jgi:hypothetical protein
VPRSSCRFTPLPQRLPHRVPHLQPHLQAHRQALNMLKHSATPIPPEATPSRPPRSASRAVDSATRTPTKMHPMTASCDPQRPHSHARRHRGYAQLRLRPGATAWCHTTLAGPGFRHARPLPRVNRQKRLLKTFQPQNETETSRSSTSTPTAECFFPVRLWPTDWISTGESPHLSLPWSRSITSFFTALGGT